MCIINFEPFQFVSALLMAYSNTKLKGNGDKTPSLKSLIRTMLEKCLPARSLLSVSLRHILLAFLLLYGHFFQSVEKLFTRKIIL
jgi:hypothetical protein